MAIGLVGRAVGVSGTGYVTLGLAVLAVVAGSLTLHTPQLLPDTSYIYDASRVMAVGIGEQCSLRAARKHCMHK